MGSIDWVDMQSDNSTVDKPTKATNAANTEPQMSTLTKASILYPAILTAFSACAILVIALFLLTHNSCCHKKRSSKSKKEDAEVEEIAGSQHTAKIVYNIPDTSHPKLTSVLQQENNDVASEVNEHYQVGDCNRAIICCPDKDGYVYDPRHKKTHSHLNPDTTTSESSRYVSTTDSSKDELCTTRGNKSARSEPVTARDRQGVGIAIKHLTEALNKQKKEKHRSKHHSTYYSHQALHSVKSKSPTHKQSIKKATHRRTEFAAHLEGAFDPPDVGKRPHKKVVKKKKAEHKADKKNKDITTTREDNSDKQVPKQEKEIAAVEVAQEILDDKQLTVERVNKTSESHEVEQSSKLVEEIPDTSIKVEKIDNAVEPPASHGTKTSERRQPFFSEKELKNAVDFKGLLIDRWVDDTIKRQGTSPTEKESEATWEIQTQLNLLYDDADSILTSVSRMDEKRLRRLRESKFYNKVLADDRIEEVKEKQEGPNALQDCPVENQEESHIVPGVENSKNIKMKSKKKSHSKANKTVDESNAHAHVGSKVEKEPALVDRKLSDLATVNNKSAKKATQHTGTGIDQGDAHKSGYMSSDIYMKKLSEIPTTCKDFFNTKGSEEVPVGAHLTTWEQESVTDPIKDRVPGSKKKEEAHTSASKHPTNCLNGKSLGTKEEPGSIADKAKRSKRGDIKLRQKENTNTYRERYKETDLNQETTQMQEYDVDDNAVQRYMEGLKRLSSKRANVIDGDMCTSPEGHRDRTFKDMRLQTNTTNLDDSSLSSDHQSESHLKSPKNEKRSKYQGRPHRHMRNSTSRNDHTKDITTTQQTLETIKEKSTFSETPMETYEGTDWLPGVRTHLHEPTSTSYGDHQHGVVRPWRLPDHIFPESDETSRLHVPIASSSRYGRIEADTHEKHDIGHWTPRDASTGISTTKSSTKPFDQRRKLESRERRGEDHTPTVSFSILKNFKEGKRPVLYVSLSKVTNLTMIDNETNEEVFVRSYLLNHSASKQESKTFQNADAVHLKELFVIKGPSTESLLTDKLIFELVSHPENNVLGQIIIDLDELNSKNSISRTETLNFSNLAAFHYRHTL